MDDERFEDSRTNDRNIKNVVLSDGRTFTYEHILKTFNTSRIK